MPSGDDEQQSYSFRNRFRLVQNQRLDSGDALEIPLSISDGETVAIRGAKARECEKTSFDDPLVVSTTDELVLLGGEYGDADAASAAGRKWRRIMAAVLARENLGVEFGPDDRIEPQAEIMYAADQDPPELLQQMGVKAGERVIWDDGYKLTVYRTNPRPRFISAEFGTPTVSVSGWLSRFQDRVQLAERAYTPWDSSRQLAYRLTHSALRDPNPETRHIQLVTAAETMIDESERPDDVMRALKALMSHIEGWADAPPDEAINGATLTRLKAILREDEKESITQAGAKQAEDLLGATYSGEAPGKFFKKVYDQRSRLVHRLRRRQERPSAEELREVHPELLRSF